MTYANKVLACPPERLAALVDACTEATVTRPTDEQLGELARLEAGATPGEWYAFFQASTCPDRPDADVSASDDDGTFMLAHVTSGSVEQCDRDRNFIIAARNALPALLAELRLLRAVVEAVEGMPLKIPTEKLAPFVEWVKWKDGAK